MNNELNQQYVILNNKIRFFGSTKTKDHLAALDKIGELGVIHDTKNKQ